MSFRSVLNRIVKVLFNIQQDKNKIITVVGDGISVVGEVKTIVDEVKK